MKTVLWILIILMLIVTVLMNYVIFYEAKPNQIISLGDAINEPHKKEIFGELDEETKKAIENEVRENIRDIRTNAKKVDISNLIRDINDPKPLFFTRIHRTLKVRWPQTLVMLKERELQNGIAYHWQGVTRKKHTYVFEIHTEEILTCLMQALDRIQENNIIPDADIYFYVSQNGNDAEFIEYLKTKNVPVSLYVKTPKDERQFDANDSRFVFVGCKVANDLHIQIEGEDKDIMEAISEMKEMTLPINKDDFLKNTISLIHEYLPFAIDMQSKIKPLNHKAIQNAMIQYPDLKRNAYPLIEVNNNEIRICNYDKGNKNSILDSINAIAKKHHCHTTVISESDAKQTIELNDKLSKEFLDYFHTKKVCYIPTYSTDTLDGNIYPTVITNLKKSHSFEGYDVTILGLYKLFTNS